MNNTQIPPDDVAMAAMASNVVMSAMPISRKKSTRKNGKHKGDDNELMRRFEQREKKKGNVMRELEKFDQSTKRHKVNEPVKDWDDTKQKFKNIEPNKKDKVEVNTGIEIPDLNHIEQQQKPQKQPDSIYVKLRSGIVINKYEKGDNVFYHDLLKSRNNKQSSEEMEANDEVDSPEENKQEIQNDNQYVEPVKDISRRPKVQTNAKVSMSNEYEMNVLNQNMERSSISNDDVLSKQPADSNQKITEHDNVDINAIEDDKNEMEDTKHDEYNGSNEVHDGDDGSNEVDNVEDKESMIDTESKEVADDEQKILTPKVEKEEKKEVYDGDDGDGENEPVEDTQEEPQKHIHPWDVVLNQNQAQSKEAGSNDGDEESQQVGDTHDIHPWDVVLNQINTKEREKKETKEDTQEIEDEAELKEPESGQEEENNECVKDTPYKPKVGKRSNWTHISDDDHDEEEKAEQIDFPDDETPGYDINDIKQNHDEDVKDDDGYYSGDSHIEFEDKESMAHDMHIRYRWRRKKDNNIKDLSPRQILPRSRRGTKKEKNVNAESTNDYDEDHETPADIKQYDDEDDEVKFDNNYSRNRVHFEVDTEHFSAMRIAAAHADRRKSLNNSSVSYPSKAAINCIPHTHFGNNYGVATTKWVKVSNEYGWIYIRDGEQEKAFRDRGYRPVPIKTPHPSHAQRRAFIQRKAQLQQQLAQQYWYHSQVLYAQIAASGGPLVHNQQHRYHNTRRIQNYQGFKTGLCPPQFVQNNGYPAQYPYYRQW